MNGIQVVLFSPSSIDWSNNTVTGFKRKDTTWLPCTIALPILIYNRFFARNATSYTQCQRTINKLKRCGCHFINSTLKGKWDVYLTLKQVPELTEYLPETHPYTGSRMLAQWLARHQSAFLKPQSGSQGKSTIYIAQNTDRSFMITGRTSSNKMIQRRFDTLRSLLLWVQMWIGKRPFLVQQYLHLHMVSGDVYDLRVLMQKDGRGQWQTTGMAIRKGAKGSMTSNLTGGGSVKPVIPLLEQQFGRWLTTSIIRTVKKISSIVPESLEAKYGAFCELGLDLGIDTSGKVWLIEVNSKPGRDIFRKLGLKHERMLSILYPIQYASYLLAKKFISCGNV